MVEVYVKDCIDLSNVEDGVKSLKEGERVWSMKSDLEESVVINLFNC